MPSGHAIAVALLTVAALGSVALAADHVGAAPAPSSPPGDQASEDGTAAGSGTSATAEDSASGPASDDGHSRAEGSAAAAPSGDGTAAERPAGPSAPAGANELCPVTTDEPIDPAFYTQYEGQRIYFCCGKCRRKFVASPALYLANLPQFLPSSVQEPRDAGAPPARSEAAIVSGRPSGEGLHFSMRVVRWLGRLHPAAVHFPIALIMAALAAELLGLFLRSERLLGAARLSLIAGGLGAAFASVLGWAAWLFATDPGEVAYAMSVHRWLGTATAIVSICGAAFALVGGDWEGPSRRRAFRFLLLVSAALVGVTAYFGGILVYGPDHYNW